MIHVRLALWLAMFWRLQTVSNALLFFFPAKSLDSKNEKNGGLKVGESAKLQFTDIKRQSSTAKELDNIIDVKLEQIRKLHNWKT